MSSQICGLSNHHTDHMFSKREMRGTSFKHFGASLTRRQSQLERTTMQHKVAYSVFLLRRQSQLPTLKLARLRQTVTRSLQSVVPEREKKKKRTHCRNVRINEMHLMQLVQCMFIVNTDNSPLKAFKKKRSAGAGKHHFYNSCLNHFFTVCKRCC